MAISRINNNNSCCCSSSSNSRSRSSRSRKWIVGFICIWVQGSVQLSFSPLICKSVGRERQRRIDVVYSVNRQLSRTYSPAGRMFLLHLNQLFHLFPFFLFVCFVSFLCSILFVRFYLSLYLIVPSLCFLSLSFELILTGRSSTVRFALWRYCVTHRWWMWDLIHSHFKHTD